MSQDRSLLERIFGGVRGQITVVAMVLTALVFTVLGTVAFLLLSREAGNDVRASIVVAIEDAVGRVAAGEQFAYLKYPSGVEVTVGTDFTPRDETELITDERTVERPDGSVVIVTAQAATASLNRTLGSIRTALWVVVPVASFLMAAGANLAIGRALRPVSAITVQTRRIADGEITEAEVPVPDSGDEIEELAQTVNLMLGRLDDAARAQRAFVSDASHELRTPLMVLTAEADLALRHPGDVDVVGFATVTSAQSARLTALADDLLAIAAGAERIVEKSPVDLAQIVLSEIESPPPSGIELVHDIAPALIAGDEQTIGRAVRNLVFNAHRYAASRVEIRLEVSGARTVLTVEDDGPGVPAQHRTRVFDRLARIGEDRGRSDGGAGLGLAIVAECARLHGGTVHVEEATLGGARFVLDLPAERVVRQS